MNSEYSKKLLIYLSCFLVVFAAFFFLFWRPRYSELKRNQEKLSRQEAKLIRLEKDAKDWPKSITREKINRYESELERLWNLIPSGEGVSALLDEIQTHARESNLAIRTLTRVSTKKSPTRNRTQKVQTNARYERVPYKLSVSGSYFGLLQFLKSLEDSKRLISINKIDMRASNGPYLMDADIEFSIFYSKVGVDKA